MNPMEMAEKLMSGELIVVVAKNPEPQKPKLSADEQALADSLVSIASKYGKFNEDETGIWAGYEKAKDNVVAHIGVKCSNCALYEGNGVCKIIAQQVEDGGKCRFAVIPDGVVKGVYSPSNEKPSPRKKKAVKYKALGATIGGGATNPNDMIDRDGDGVVLDGTPDEQPVKRKPKRDYEPMDNSFLEKRRRKFVRSELNRQGIKPTRNDESHIYERPDGSLHIYDGRTPEEIQARREARAEYDRRMRAGEPMKERAPEQTPEQEKPATQYPPGYVPGRPADRYPDPGAYVPGKPADRYPQANIPSKPKYPNADSAREDNLRKYPMPSSQKPNEEWDGIVRGRGMQYVASRYPNRPGGANSRVAKDPKWIAEQIKRQRESQSAVDSRNENARRRDEQREANNADRRDLDARTRDFYARGGGRDGNMRNQTAASPVSRARNMSDDSSNEDDRPFRPVPMPIPQARQPKDRMQPRPMPTPRTPRPAGSQRTGRNFSQSRDDNEGRLNRDSSGRVTGVDRNRPNRVNPRGPGGGNLIAGEDGRGRGINIPRTAPTPIEPNRPGKDKYDIPDPADEREPGKIEIGRYPRDPNKARKPGKIENGRYPRDPNKPRQPGKAIPYNPGTFTPDVQRFPKGQNPRTNPQPRKPMRPGGSDGRYDRNRRTSGGFNQEGR